MHMVETLYWYTDCCDAAPRHSASARCLSCVGYSIIYEEHIYNGQASRSIPCLVRAAEGSPCDPHASGCDRQMSRYLTLFLSVVLPTVCFPAANGVVYSHALW